MSARADLYTPCHQCGHPRAYHCRGRCEWIHVTDVDTWERRAGTCACEGFVEGVAA